MPGGLALVLSGGGAKGAFQVGVLDELISKKGVKFDIVVGTSTGALQALGVAQGDIPGMLAEWLAIKGNNDIYKERQLGIAGGILGADAIYDASPLRKIVKRFADPDKLKATGIRMLLGVVNLGTGQFQTVNETETNIHDWVYASCAMPLFFDPLKTQQGSIKEQWVDGGVRNVTPLSAALALRPRAVLVVRASPKPKVGTARVFPNLIKIGLRAVDILQSEVSVNDLANATLINDLLAARESVFKELEAQGITGAQATTILRALDAGLAKYQFAPIRVIEPDKEFSDTLEFDPAKIREAIQSGRDSVDHAWTALEPFLT